MHRVVTKHIHYPEGVRKLAVHRGPWHPDVHIAQRWVDYLVRTGRYDHVELETKGQVADGSQSKSSRN